MRRQLPIVGTECREVFIEWISRRKRVHKCQRAVARHRTLIGIKVGRRWRRYGYEWCESAIVDSELELVMPQGETGGVHEIPLCLSAERLLLVKISPRGSRIEKDHFSHRARPQARRPG